MKKRLLFLTYYYKPDLDAGSFRSTMLVNEFTKLFSDKWQVDVVTTMPNRYSTYSSDALPLENHDSLSVRRINIPEHKSGMFDQSKGFLRFAMNVLKETKGTHYDAVFATSSRLATGFLGSWVANRKKIPFYLDIRDIFPDTMNDVLEGSPLKILLPVLRIAERYTVKSASRVNLVSKGFLSYYENQGIENKFSSFPNGIDELFLDHDFKKNEKTNKKIMLYAGNIGDGQGLHRIVPDLAYKLGDEWVIRIVGDGGKRSELEACLKRGNVDNVELIKPVPRQQLLEHYRNADVLFMHLNDYKAFKRVLPSKIFEYAATGKPILAGVGGYAAEFIESNVPNASIFSPCEAGQALSSIKDLQINQTERAEFIRNYSREFISKQMVEEMLSIFEDNQK